MTTVSFGHKFWGQTLLLLLWNGRTKREFFSYRCIQPSFVCLQLCINIFQRLICISEEAGSSVNQIIPSYWLVFSNQGSDLQISHGELLRNSFLISTLGLGYLMEREVTAGNLQVMPVLIQSPLLEVNECFSWLMFPITICIQKSHNHTLQNFSPCLIIILAAKYC